MSWPPRVPFNAVASGNGSRRANATNGRWKFRRKNREGETEWRFIAVLVFPNPLGFRTCVPPVQWIAEIASPLQRGIGVPLVDV